MGPAQARWLRAALNAVLRDSKHPAVDLAPTFQYVFQRNRLGAQHLAEAYAESIKDPLHHRELFQQAALMPAPQRKTLIKGYCRVGQARGVGS